MQIKWRGWVQNILPCNTQDVGTLCATGGATLGPGGERE